MKTRTSLVSNSSTSSFVLIGYKMNLRWTDTEMKMSIIKKLNPSLSITEDVDGDVFHDVVNENRKDFDVLYDGEGNAIYFGYVICNLASDEYNDLGGFKPVELSDIIEKCNNVKALFNFQDSLKIYTGTRAC